MFIEGDPPKDVEWPTWVGATVEFVTLKDTNHDRHVCVSGMVGMSAVHSRHAGSFACLSCMICVPVVYGLRVGRV